MCKHLSSKYLLSTRSDLSSEVYHPSSYDLIVVSTLTTKFNLKKTTRAKGRQKFRRNMRFPVRGNLSKVTKTLLILFLQQSLKRKMAILESKTIFQGPRKSSFWENFRVPTTIFHGRALRSLKKCNLRNHLYININTTVVNN